MYKSKLVTCHEFFNVHILYLQYGFGLIKPNTCVCVHYHVSSPNAFNWVHEFCRVRRIEVRAWTKVSMGHTAIKQKEF